MSYPLHSFIGESPALLEVIAFIGKIARSKRSVLIEGESGTGKELAAEAIHRNSGRNGRCVALNCAGMSEDLLENELFGHEAEAFTGASKRRSGKFEEADKGTLFLDEIGEISMRVQAKLLRAIEYGEFQKVGGAATIKVDIRVIAATNRNLEAAVKNGEFRLDLYHRLNVLTLRMPPLRERRSDIPILADTFIKRSAAEEMKSPPSLLAEAESLLCDYAWPGNVRQLLHVIGRAVTLSQDGFIKAQDLQIEKPAEAPMLKTDSSGPMEYEGLDDALYRFKRDYVANVVAATKGNFTKAAQILKKHPGGLARLLDSLDLSHLKHTQRDRLRSVPVNPSGTSEMTKLPIGVMRIIADEQTTDYIVCASQERIAATGGQLPAQCFVGICLQPVTDGERIQPDNFAANSHFLALLHDVVALRGPSTPDLIERAQNVWSGTLYVIDQRTLTPETEIPEEYLIGEFAVEDGLITPGSYRPNPNYYLLTSDGFLRLEPDLEDCLLEALATLPNPDNMSETVGPGGLLN